MNSHKRIIELNSSTTDIQHLKNYVSLQLTKRQFTPDYKEQKIL